MYLLILAPLFVFQWLFDEAQMRADHVGAPVTPQQWDYIHDMGGALRESLNNVTAVFAPSCIGHSVLTKRDWMNIKIDDVSLADALRCWEQSDVRDRQVQRRQSNRNPSPQKMRRKHNGGRRKKTQNDPVGQGQEEVPKPKLTKEERARRRQERQLQRSLNRLNNKNSGREGGKNHTRHQQRLEESLSTKVPRLERSPNRTGKNSNSPSSGSPNSKKQQQQQQNQNGHHRLRNENKKRLNHKNRNRKNMNNRKHQQQQQQQQNVSPFGLDLAEPKKCSLRLLERCSWPQCNHSCPTLTNPLTGEEMKFLELLASFGLDMDAVATALGVDMQTLNNMDHAELVNLLTQQVT